LEVVQGWFGAESADQDFMYSDGWYEIKSIVASALTVSISSLEQLDCADSGELVVMRIDKSAQECAGAVSLYEVVQRIKDTISAETQALDLFQTKLMAYGYLDLLEYDEQKYMHSSTQYYGVDDSFPRLVKNNVPSQIVAVHYEIDIASLVDWMKG
jgi:hypothetical protein